MGATWPQTGASEVTFTEKYCPEVVPEMGTSNFFPEFRTISWVPVVTAEREIKVNLRLRGSRVRAEDAWGSRGRRAPE